MIVLALLFVVAIVALAVTDSGSPRRKVDAPVTAPEHRNRGPPAR